MLKQTTLFISGLRTCLQVLILLLCFCMAASPAWLNAGASHNANSTVISTFVVEQLNEHNGPAIKQGKASRQLPSLRSSTPKLQPATRIRHENRDNGFIPAQLSWALTSTTVCLPALRIVPVVWGRGTPPFLLPFAYGLIPFAIPPPFLLV
ncbi:hypothetical protein LJB93_01780 [Desulfovibrio sp. OttesenSCG-928-F07]|nr:hypothetical protein [Desulfovibrio sp. OttesenSCG-928-F07]